MEDTFLYALYFYIQVCNKKDDTFTTMKINDLAKTMFVLMWFYIEELFWWNCTTNFLIISFCIFLKYSLLKIIYKAFFPTFQQIIFYSADSAGFTKLCWKGLFIYTKHKTKSNKGEKL